MPIAATWTSYLHRDMAVGLVAEKIHDVGLKLNLIRRLVQCCVLQYTSFNV